MLDDEGQSYQSDSPLTVYLPRITGLKSVKSHLLKSIWYPPSFHLTLGEVLVQVEFDPSAAEAENFASLGQQAWEVEPILAHWVHQQEGAHLSCLALWRTWEERLKRSESDRLYLLYKLRNDWLVSKACSQVLGRYVNELKPSHGKKGRDREEEREIKNRVQEREWAWLINW